MDVFGRAVVVQINSSCALTPLSMPPRTSLTKMLLAHFVTNIAFTLSPVTHLQRETERFGDLTVGFG